MVLRFAPWCGAWSITQPECSRRANTSERTRG